MHKITGDRDAVETLMRDTVEQLERGAQQAGKKGGVKAASAAKKTGAAAKKGAAKKGETPEEVAAVFRQGLERLEGKKGGVRAAGTRKAQAADEPAVPRPFAPRDQLIALFQSAMDEFLDETVGPVKPDAASKAGAKKGTKAASAKKGAAQGGADTLDPFYGGAKKGAKAGTKTGAANIFAKFGNLDPRWGTVITEKAKLLFKGKRKFIAHKSAEDFRFRMGDEATVAVVGDWGGGNAAAQSVAQQIAKLAPDHVIHLGDVYYSGTPKEVKERFLKYWPTPEDPGYSFALNSNHEMYSGGYGYFDHTLKQFKQPASYFSLANDNWRFIGLDTGYDEHDLHGPQADWLRGQFDGGGPKTIFMSHHQLFSAYEKTDARKLRDKVSPFLGQLYGWVWGHEHLAIVYEKHEGINAVCLGNGCFPYKFPKGQPSVPIRWLDDHQGSDPDYPGGHTFGLFTLKGPRMTLAFYDERGNKLHTETWQ